MIKIDILSSYVFKFVNRTPLHIGQLSCSFICLIIHVPWNWCPHRVMNRSVLWKFSIQIGQSSVLHGSATQSTSRVEWAFGFKLVKRSSKSERESMSEKRSSRLAWVSVLSSNPESNEAFRVSWFLLFVIRNGAFGTRGRARLVGVVGMIERSLAISARFWNILVTTSVASSGGRGSTFNWGASSCRIASNKSHRWQVRRLCPSVPHNVHGIEKVFWKTTT